MCISFRKDIEIIVSRRIKSMRWLGSYITLISPNRGSSFDSGWWGLGNFGRGHLGRGHYGRGHLGRGHYGRGHFGRGHFGRGHFGPLI